MKMNKNIIILIIGTLFLISACTQQTAQPESTGSQAAVTAETPAPGTTGVIEKVVNRDTTEEPESKETIAPEAEATKTVKMTARQWTFDPDTITVNKGDTVRLEVTSIDVTHGLAISQFGVNVRLIPGATEIVEFTADKAGTFPFICSVPCGRGHRTMTGQLIVQ